MYGCATHIHHYVSSNLIAAFNLVLHFVLLLTVVFVLIVVQDESNNCLKTCSYGEVYGSAKHNHHSVWSNLPAESIKVPGGELLTRRLTLRFLLRVVQHDSSKRCVHSYGEVYGYATHIHHSVWSNLLPAASLKVPRVEGNFTVFGRLVFVANKR